jgi:arylsulfatase A-like enzyme
MTNTHHRFRGHCETRRARRTGSSSRTRSLSLAGFLLAGLATIVSLSCSAPTAEEGQRAERSMVRKILDERYSETRLNRVPSYVERMDLDLREAEARRTVTFISMETRPLREGLRIEPTNDDPILYFGEGNMAFNHVVVEMTSTEDSFLEVFWATDSASFGPDRKVRVPVGFSVQPKLYTVELPIDPQPGEEYKIRIDPVHGQIPFTLHRVSFGRVVHLPAGSDPEDQAAPGPVVGKARAGDLLRSVMVLGPRGSESHRLPITLADGSDLVFGLAMPKESQSSGRFQILFHPDGAAEGGEVVFEAEVDEEGKDRWTDHRVTLDGLAGGNGILEARVEPLAGPDSPGRPVVFWATPRLERRGDRPGRPNLILISLDTLGALHLPLYDPGGGGPSTPGLDELASAGVLFEDVTTGSSLTHAAHAVLLSGRLPLRGSLFWMSNRQQDETTLASLLRREGYVTGGFTGGVMVTERLGFDRGFETFYQADSLYRPRLERSDAIDVTTRALEWLDATGSAPYFLFLHSYEVHGPHYFTDDSWRDRRLASQPLRYNYLRASHMRGSNPAPRETAGQFVSRLTAPEVEETLGEVPLSEGDRRHLVDAYHQEISRLDGILRDFLHTLEARGYLENTVVAVTSDHGEGFFEHGLFEHGLLYEENLRVPLIVRGPTRLPAGTRIPGAVHSVDVVPTLLDLLDVEADYEMDGRSLMPLVEGGRPAATDDRYTFVPGSGFAWKTPEGKKVILRNALLQESFGRHELFDLAADPDETTNLLDSGEDAVPEGLRRSIRSTLRGLPAVYLGLQDFAGRELELSLKGPGLTRDRVYAIEMEGDGFVEDGKVWRGKIRPQEGAVLFFLGLSPQATVGLELGDSSGEEAPLRFSLELARLSKGRLRIASEGSSGGPFLTVWQVGEALFAETGELASEEEQKLRSLGYIQ